MSTAYFVIPGDINTRTGGYRYDKQIIRGLQQSGWSIEIISLHGDFPFPDQTARLDAQETLAAIPDGSRVIIDGLAYAVLPEQLKAHYQRLQLIALVHHPLALETGIDPHTAMTLRAQETNALTYAWHVITTSPSTAASLDDYAVSSDRISVVCPGTDLAPVASGSLTAELNLLCVATLTPRKGHGILLDALEPLRQHNWHLYCAGSVDRDPDTYSALQQQCKVLGMESRVSFLGELDDEQLRACFNQADLFLLASFHEGYGMVLDEAIACALPVVATAGGAIVDTVPKEAGLLVPPGDTLALSGALRRIMEEDTLLDTLRQGASGARQSLRPWAHAAQEFETVLRATEPSHV